MEIELEVFDLNYHSLQELVLLIKLLILFQVLHVELLHLLVNYRIVVVNFHHIEALVLILLPRLAPSVHLIRELLVLAPKHRVFLQLDEGVFLLDEPQLLKLSSLVNESLFDAERIVLNLVLLVI